MYSLHLFNQLVRLPENNAARQVFVLIKKSNPCHKWIANIKNICVLTGMPEAFENSEVIEIKNAKELLLLDYQCTGETRY